MVIPKQKTFRKVITMGELISNNRDFSQSTRNKEIFYNKNCQWQLITYAKYDNLYINYQANQY